MIVSDCFDVLVLDVMMLWLDGFEVCCQFCSIGDDLLILVLIVCDLVFEWVVGLDVGVDDYLLKLFVFEELLVWMWVLLCCIKFEDVVELMVMRFFDLMLDLVICEVNCGQCWISLICIEFVLLEMLIVNLW